MFYIDSLEDNEDIWSAVRRRVIHEAIQARQKEKIALLNERYGTDRLTGTEE